MTTPEPARLLIEAELMLRLLIPIAERGGIEGTEPTLRRARKTLREIEAYHYGAKVS